MVSRKASHNLEVDGLQQIRAKNSGHRLSEARNSKAGDWEVVLNKKPLSVLIAGISLLSLTYLSRWLQRLRDVHSCAVPSPGWSSQPAASHFPHNPRCQAGWDQSRSQSKPVGWLLWPDHNLAACTPPERCPYPTHHHTLCPRCFHRRPPHGPDSCCSHSQHGRWAALCGRPEERCQERIPAAVFIVINVQCFGYTSVHFIWIVSEFYETMLNHWWTFWSEWTTATL